MTLAPSLRRYYGVYETPPRVVGAHVRLVHDVLRRRFGVAHGFGDLRVVVVDPAAGRGTYGEAVQGLAGASLAGRLHVFEAQAEEAAHAQAALGTAVHVRDVLAEPLSIDGDLVVCLGNPPYNRQVIERGDGTERKGGWVRFGSPPLLADFIDPQAGVHLKSLYNDYVYFWRWALWSVFEQRRGPGIVSFITASSYLHGPAFGAMRRWLRGSVDELWIVDLEGDGRGTRRTDNVFAGVQTPVAIAIAARYGNGCATRAHYSVLGGSREQKLARLECVQGLQDLEWQHVSGSDAAPLRPTAATAYSAWPSLTELFPRQFSGCQVKRRWPIAPHPEVLRRRWREFVQLEPGPREQAFGSTRDRTTGSTPGGLLALKELESNAPCPPIVPYAYRSFDRQWLLYDARLGDFLRPRLWQLAGPNQVFLTTLLTHPLGAGPGAVAASLVPDLDHFRGSFGGRAVIPLWLGGEPNVAQEVLEQLSIEPRALMAYCYALLSTPSYQERFAEELRTPGARVPIARSADVFARAAALGEKLLRLHTQTMVQSTARVSPEVWHFSVSGLQVVKSWLKRRIGMWQPGMSREFLSLLSVLQATLELRTQLDEVLDQAARDCIKAVSSSSRSTTSTGFNGPE